MTVTKHDMLQYNVRMHPSRTSTQHARRHCGPESVCALYKMPSDLHAFWTFDLQRLFLICAHHVLGSGHYAILRARTVSPTSWKNRPRFACKIKIQMSRVLHSYIPFVILARKPMMTRLKADCQRGQQAILRLKQGFQVIDELKGQENTGDNPCLCVLGIFYFGVTVKSLVNLLLPHYSLFVLSSLSCSNVQKKKKKVLRVAMGCKFARSHLLEKKNWEVSSV